MIDARLSALAKSLPPGATTGKSGSSSPDEVKRRKVAIATRTADGCLKGQTIWRNRDLATLPECATLKSFRGIGDFLGKGGGGLDLNRVYVKGDMYVTASPQNALKAWNWLSEQVSDRDSIAVKFGYIDGTAVDQHLLSILKPSTDASDSEQHGECHSEQAT